MILSKILMVGFLYLKDYLWLILFGLISQASKVFLTEKQAKMHFTLDTYLKIGITQKMDKGKSLFVYFSSLMRILQNVVCESNSSNCDWITRFHLILNSVSYNIFEKILVLLIPVSIFIERVYTECSEYDWHKITCNKCLIIQINERNWRIRNYKVSLIFGQKYTAMSFLFL